MLLAIQLTLPRYQMAQLLSVFMEDNLAILVAQTSTSGVGFVTVFSQ
jgi:hypothetical protein